MPAHARSDDMELDRGPRARERERQCIATRQVRSVAELIRFVVDTNGEAVADVRLKLPGRGVWVTATQQAIGEAVKRKAFARAFKRDVRLPADLVERTERALERAVVDALAIAGKAGLVAAGFTRAENALAHDDVIAILHACEAAEDGVRKLNGALRHRPGRPIAVIGALSAAQLGLALNRPNVIHAALLAGSASETFLARYRRFERFRTGDQPQLAETAAPNEKTAAPAAGAYGNGSV